MFVQTIQSIIWVQILIRRSRNFPRHAREIAIRDLPEDEDIDEIEDMKLTLVNSDFEMHYQQDCDGQALPSINAADFGGCADHDYLDLGRVISIDTGVNDSEGSSFSVVQVWSSDGLNHYLVDQYRERCEFRELARMTYRLCKRHRAKHILIEHTANGPA